MSGDALDPRSFSGLPAFLCRALADAGASVVPVDVLLPPPWQRLLVNLMTLGFLDPRVCARSLRERRSVRLAFRENKPRLHPSREMAAIKSAAARVRLRRRGPVDRAIAYGSEFRLPEGMDYVTLDDATIVQLRRGWDYHWMQAVSDGALRRMIARQRRIFHRARACCLLTHWAADSAMRDYGVPERRVHVVGCGPNRELRPAPRDWSAPRFLFVGRDFERKNGPMVLRAFAEVRSRWPSATLDLVGDHPRIEQPGVRGHGVRDLTSPADVALTNALFERATCFVMPSMIEPAGHVFAEALAAGVGSIGPREGGSPTIIGDAGATVGAGDFEDLERQMLRFCDPDEAQRLAACARRRAALFTWRAVAERVLRALDLPGFPADTLAAPL
jgi:glycosyltransferase involved in cell wall biosynthesis